MSTLSALETFFKPETRKSGHDLFAKNTVFISSASDTQIQAYVRASSSPRVSFKSESISDTHFVANCTCTASAKDQLCKHMWATLLAVDDKHLDFLESKTSISKGESKESPQKAKPAPSAEFVARAEQMKERQAEYRKQQYQKQKDRAKEMKRSQKHGAVVTPKYPEVVREALDYFSKNGFEIEKTFNEEELSNARKKLSRVFHPDKGGSHEEIVLLNENYEILEQYLSDSI